MQDVVLTFVLVGAGLFLGGAFFLVNGRRRTKAMKRFNARATTVQAQVLELRRHQMATPGHTGDHWFAPLVRFALPDGRIVEGETMTGSNPPPARVGDVIWVRIDPDDPTRINLASGFASGGAVGWIHALLGAGLMVFGAVACLIGYAISRLPT